MTTFGEACGQTNQCDARHSTTCARLLNGLCRSGVSRGSHCLSRVDLTYLDGRSLPPGVSGVLLTRKFAPTLELALRLHPMTENVVVVSGGAEIDIKLLELARKQFQPYDGRVSFRYLTALPMQELLKELSRLPPRTIVLHTTFFSDGTGQAFVPHDVVGRVSKAASVPVYGFIDQYVGRGLVGGDVYSFAAHGAQAAMLALQVVGGNTSSGMVVAGRSMVLFDWRQLQRWQISESRLPPGSEILFVNQPFGKPTAGSSSQSPQSYWFKLR